VIELLLYRILLGYYYIDLKDIKYKIVYPNMQIKYNAEILYQQIIEDNKFDKRWLTNDEIKSILIRNGIWNDSKEEELSKSNKFLEDLKIELYLNFSNEQNKNKIKINIKSIRNNIEEMIALKKSMNNLGIEDHALSLKNEFIIMNTIYLNNELYFKDPYNDSYNSQDLNLFIYEIVKNNIDLETIRSIAKSDSWKQYAQCCDLKKNIQDMNEDYKNLISIHNMYENVKQHPEAPSSDIIDDNDALDGWFLYHNRKAEKEKKKNTVLNKVGGKVKDKGEVYLISNDANEIKEVMDLNDHSAKQDIKELIKIGQNLSEGESINWSEVPSVQRQLKKQIQSNHKSKRK